MNVAHLVNIEVFLAVSVFLKEFTRSVTKELVVGYLEFKGFAIPFVVKLHIVRVDEGQFLV